MWTKNRKKRKIENKEITKLNLKKKWMTIKKIGKNYSWEGRKASKKIQDESVSSRVRSGGRVGGRQGAGEPRAGVRVGGVQTWVRCSPHWPAGVARGGPLQRTDLNLQVQQLPLCEIIKRREVKVWCSKDGEQQAEPGLANHSIGLQPRMILWPLFRESGHIPGPTTSSEKTLWIAVFMASRQSSSWNLSLAILTRYPDPRQPDGLQIAQVYSFSAEHWHNVAPWPCSATALRSLTTSAC